MRRLALSAALLVQLGAAGDNIPEPNTLNLKPKTLDPKPETPLSPEPPKTLNLSTIPRMIRSALALLVAHLAAARAKCMYYLGTWILRVLSLGRGLQRFGPLGFGVWGSGKRVWGLVFEVL